MPAVPHVPDVWRRRSRGAGRLHYFTTIEEVVALLDEALDDRLVEFGGGQRVLVLKVGPHERRPEADGQIVCRHQRRLTLLAHPDRQKVARLPQRLLPLTN